VPSVPAATPPVEETARGRRRRRPTGAPPPLPKKVGRTGKWWLIAMVVFSLWLGVLVLVPQVRRQTYRFDTEVLQFLASVRTGWLTEVMSFLDRLATGWALTAVAMTLLVLQMIFRRWRHLFAFVGAVFITYQLGALLYNAFSRPRPFGVTIIGRWAGFSMPSPPVAILAMVPLAGKERGSKGLY
jgi:hypothetical protein